MYMYVRHILASLFIRDSYPAGLRATVDGQLRLAAAAGGKLRAGALLGLCQLGYRDPDASALLAAVAGLLEAAADALKDDEDERCVCCAACLLGIILMHVRQPELTDGDGCPQAAKFLSLGVADSVVGTFRLHPS